jgi:hypothetical protein
MVRNRPNRLDFPTGKGMNHRGVIYIPSTTAKNKNISKTAFNNRVNMVSRQIAKTFGGNTVQRMGFGNWIDDDGKLISEKVARIEFYADKKTYLKNDHKLARMLHRLQNKWGQWALSYEYQSPSKARALHFIIG